VRFETARVSVANELLALYAARGAATYFGEVVTTAEHSLQTAHFAQLSGASDTLVLAALLHDIGHLLGGASNDLADWNDDARHEVSGGRWLAARFSPAVAEPVRLHVPAKRFLCATDAEFINCLSAASIQTLKLQGGPMSQAEIAAFESEPYSHDAIRLRQWDDQGKVVGLATPAFSHYVAIIDKLAS
jgi:[1-hydroxy-2-(trimethylamino)ethyl]phosphonate dioxygenase